jgi:hypothetical protein
MMRQRVSLQKNKSWQIGTFAFACVDALGFLKGRFAKES